VVTDYTREDLQAFIARDKFAADPEAGYAGMPNLGIARRLTRAMNASLEILLRQAEETRSRTEVLQRVRGFLGAARPLGLAEPELERILWCYGEACDILGIRIDREQEDKWRLALGLAP
jgi:hypothetical protein